MDFLLNIGNTHTEIAMWNHETIGPVRSVPTETLTSGELPPDGDGFAVSVVPHINTRLSRRNITFLSVGDAKEIIDFSRMDVSTLGADRIANAVAAATLFPLPAAVFDCGTAITMELIDAEHRFLGGAITPGRALLRRSLRLFTAQLPEPELSGSYDARTENHTAGAITFGCDAAAVGALREFLSAARRLTGTETRFIATGGDAPFFVEALKGELTTAPEHFTLTGAAVMAKLKRNAR